MKKIILLGFFAFVSTAMGQSLAGLKSSVEECLTASVSEVVPAANETGTIIGRRIILKCSGKIAESLFLNSAIINPNIREIRNNAFGPRDIRYINRALAPQRSQCSHNLNNRTYDCSFTLDLSRDIVKDENVSIIQECLLANRILQRGQRDNLVTVGCGGIPANRLYSIASQYGVYERRDSVLLALPSFDLYSFGQNELGEKSSYCTEQTNSRSHECRISLDLHLTILNSIEPR